MMKLSRKRKHVVILPFCALLFFIGTVTVQAATYYVEKTGSDSNNGSESQPFRTIASGVNSLNAGDTLYIRSGTWTEQIDVEAKTGTPGNYITIAAYPGETVTIDTNLYPFAIKGTYSANNAYFIFDGLILEGTGAANLNYWTIGNGSHHIIARNLGIKHWKGHGILVSGADNVQIVNCKIHDQISLSGLPGERWYGIYYHHGDNGLIEGNNIYNNPGGGMQLYPGPITGLVVRRNAVHDNNSLVSSNLGGIIVAQNSDTPITGVEISNNLIYNNGSAPVHGPSTGLKLFYGASGVKVWNNTIYGNRGHGIDVGTADVANTVIQNNIVYANESSAINNVGTGTIQNNNLTSNPSFVNAGAFNFDLQTSSPAIDAGMALSKITMDIKKTPRPQGATHDIGAFEVGTGSDNVAPDPPKGLGFQ